MGELMLGEEFAGFRLLGVLGRGAFGETYKAEREGKLYALKVLHESLLDSVDMERLRREVEALRRPSSARLVECSDWGQEEPGGRTYHWLAMLYFEGQTLTKEVAAAGGVLPPARARLIVGGIARGLQALHELRIVHRDVKPDNVFIRVSSRLGGEPGRLPRADGGRPLPALIAQQRSRSAGQAAQRGRPCGLRLRRRTAATPLDLRRTASRVP
jgi:serine/threonine protein kinase